MSITQRMSDRDARLAAGKFSGRESATEWAERKRREDRAAQVKKAARAGQAWEDDDRRRNG
ncbi:hypothetical protein [Embleya sp. AB8]|uniref:hypothetical protein n=1 Tax=Embleya sp. AB8 TaxID=3156304 RepID=UPI003C77DD50